MTSEETNEAYVWVWLPDETAPVIAGRLEQVGGVTNFNYGRSYLARTDAVPLYEPELPLMPGIISPRGRLTIPGCIDDASPDAWGKRVIMHKMLGEDSSDRDPADLDPLTYLLQSGSDRIGALDFQKSPMTYVARTSAQASIESLMEAAEKIEAGLPLPRAIADALLHGSSIGGAWPKSLIDDHDQKWIAKFSSSSSTYPVIQGEYVAMELARRAGINVAPVKLERVLNSWVLLIRRFDRTRAEGGWQRRMMVSSLTLLELHELEARYATYVDLANVIRARFADFKGALRELFSRIIFNILVGNTDDHARNHAAFWDGSSLALTPAYDICPQPRAGGEAAQAMAIGNGFRMSNIAGCIQHCDQYMLSIDDAKQIAMNQIKTIMAEWENVCDAAHLGEAERNYFWKRQFLNPYALEGFDFEA